MPPPIWGTTPRVAPQTNTPIVPATKPAVTTTTPAVTPNGRDVLEPPVRPVVPGMTTPVVRPPSVPIVPGGPVAGAPTGVNSEGVKTYNYSGTGAGTAKASLAWTNPTTNIDGTPCTDLAGVKIYFGLEHGKYTNVIDAGKVDKFEITGLPTSGVFHCQVTAYDAAGNESPMSNEVEKLLK